MNEFIKKQARRSIRFPADAGTLALLKWKTNGELNTLAALVINESAKGCCIITTEKPRDGLTCRARVGHLSEVEADIVWVKSIDRGVWKAGLKYHL